MNAIKKGMVAGTLGVVFALATGMPMAGALQDRDQIAPTRPARRGRAGRARVGAQPQLDAGLRVAALLSMAEHGPRPRS